MLATHVMVTPGRCLKLLPGAGTTNGRSPLHNVLVSIGIVLGVAGCGGGKSAPETQTLSPDVYVYKADLGGWASNSGRWYNYVQSDADCSSGVGFPISWVSPASCFQFLTPHAGASGNWVTSTGPWWIDTNHMALPGGTGYGFINVLAFTPLPAGFRSPANLDDTALTFTARIDSQFSTVMADSREGRQQGHVYLWFQTSARPISPCTPDPQIGEDCTRQSNYVLTGNGQPGYGIDRISPGVATDFAFSLKASETDRWTCLGRGFNVKYDCMGVEEALRNVAVLGFVIAPVAGCPTLRNANGLELCDLERIAQSPSEYFNLGKFEVRSLTVRKNKARATAATRLAFVARALEVTEVPPRWSSPQYAEATKFVTGGGLQMSVPKPLGAMRLGLGVQSDPRNLEEAGYQIYLSPAGTDPGQTENIMMVVGRGTSGLYDVNLSFWPFLAGDTVGFYFENGVLHFLKNDEVFYQVPSPCGNADVCTLHPFLSTADGYDAPLSVFKY